MEIDISNPPSLDQIPDSRYLDVMPDDDDFEIDAFDIGAVEVPLVSQVPLPKPERKEYTPRKQTVDEEFIEPVLDVPERLRNTVIGRLASVIHDKIEFPEMSSFLSLLASASCSVSTSYATQYVTGDAVALGMYVIVEQPPAMMKSYLLDVGMSPYRLSIGKHNKKINAKNREMKEREIENYMPLNRSFTETSDGTTASIDGFLSGCSEGRFVISSAEQSGLISLFPEGTYSSTNELILKGYAGEYVSGMRAGRKAFCGMVQGSVIIIAQPGSSKRVLAASGGSGMAERFIYIAEPDPIGFRRNEGKFPTRVETGPFVNACAKCVDTYSDKVMSGASENQDARIVMDPENLIRVRASDEGYAMMLAKKNGNEGYLYELKMSGEMVLMGWLSKIITHTIKIAANIHIIECLANDCKVSEVIPNWLIEDCLDLVMTLSHHIKGIMNKSGESGSSAEEETVIDLLSRGGMNKRGLVLAAKNRKPFKSMPGAYKIAASRVEAMIESKILMVSSAGKIEVV